MVHQTHRSPMPRAKDLSQAQVEKQKQAPSMEQQRSEMAKAPNPDAWPSDHIIDRFQIVPEGAPRDAGNQVTQKEFDRVLEVLNGIADGESDLFFGQHEGMTLPEYKTFARAALEDLADIMQTSSGRQLIEELHASPTMPDGTRQKTSISQFGGANPRNDDARGGGTPWAKAGGGGVQYLPREEGGVYKKLRSDVLLYHELVHAHEVVYSQPCLAEGVTIQGTASSADVKRLQEEKCIGAAPVTLADGATAIDAGLVAEKEYKAVGLGKYAKASISENQYRKERNAIGASNYAEREGDDTMPQRDSYLGFDPAV